MWPAAAWLRPKWHRTPTFAGRPAIRGISTVIPSRNGRHLLEAQFPGLREHAADVPGEIVVVDNGSDDGTAAWLAGHYPEVRVIADPAALSFSRAVNRGIAVARYSHVCLLNNDMLLEPGFFSALWRAFEQVPDLFCATAQIRFPPGVRREETGKAVMAQSSPDDFPIRCDEPLAGEDGTWVLYGSGGCSLYDAARLRALGNLDEAYEPAYVEDMDIGWRAWQQGWPSVYVAGAVVEHRHRATTSRYYTAAELERALEINYLRFLVRAVDSGKLFRRLWREALNRYRRTRRGPSPREAASLIREGGRLVDVKFAEEEFLAVTDGSVSVFPGGGRDVLLLEVDRLVPPPLELAGRYHAVVMWATPSAPSRSSDKSRFCEEPAPGPWPPAPLLALAARRWPGATLWTASAGEPARPLRTT